MERALTATYSTEHLETIGGGGWEGGVLQHLSFCRRGNRENKNNSNTAAIDNNNRVKIVVDTENRGNHHVNKNKVNESYY